MPCIDLGPINLQVINTMPLAILKKYVQKVACILSGPPRSQPVLKVLAAGGQHPSLPPLSPWVSKLPPPLTQIHAGGGTCTAGTAAEPRLELAVLHWEDGAGHGLHCQAACSRGASLAAGLQASIPMPH